VTRPAILAGEAEITPADIEWAQDFLLRHPGPSDPREFAYPKDDWIKAKLIMQTVEAR
jgi:hypothetical protein